MERAGLQKLKERLEAALAAGTPEAYAALAPYLPEAATALGQTALSSGQPDEDLENVLKALEAAWLRGEAFPVNPERSPEQQARLARLLEDIRAAQSFAIAMSKGDLSRTLRAKGMMAGGLKAMQANLRHLTWQTRMVAKGDFSQRVDFLGDFSTSFNAMVDSLAEAHDQLKRRERLIESLNAQLQQKVEDLLAANRELEAFSYSVSHDLRTPLRAIDGFSQILRRDYGEQLEAEGQRFLEIICSNTRNMGQLIDDLLAFSRLGRQKIDRVDLDMGALVGGVISELAATEAGRDIGWEIKPLPRVRGDRSLLRQVWSNLLANALKFTQPRGRAVIEIGYQPDGKAPAYYVKDNGVGFDMQYAHKLFGVFQRLHRVEEFPGTGVGLALVQRIVERHGGRVWGEGKVGAGAVFYFSLPEVTV